MAENKTVQFPVERLFLIGLMGCGKSFFGQKLAQQLGWKFIDLDAQIEAETGLTISQIFEKLGEKEFRILEQNCLRQTFSIQHCVVATGGGTPIFYENMAEMQQNGHVFYLKTTQKLLFQRLSSDSFSRPLIAKLSKNELKKFISTQIKSRKSFYERADFVVFQAKNNPDFFEKILLKLPKIAPEKAKKSPKNPVT